MASLFGGPDTSKQEARIAQQEAETKKRENEQAKELASRRKVAGQGSKSQTLFSQVLGTDESIKKSALGD